MLCHNDNIVVKDDIVIGTIKDLKEYFRYEIAHQCLTGSECDYENFSNNVRNIMELLDKLYDLNNENNKIKVFEHPMGGFDYEREI